MEACIPEMKDKGWGRILNISSISARNGGYVGPHSAASKAGLIGLTRFYAQSAVKHGITVNAISPGAIDTDMLRDPPFGEDVTPVGRFGKPEEVAHIAMFIMKYAGGWREYPLSGVCVMSSPSRRSRW
ncbi:SDR family NAD(P)-dependent oxidoreductase [Halostella sp. PRR32]|uniref:SDR family NAD(P)-dependent oxidoreductase n=1 Tax=Halostella sp. PRR32 TaxID=3098147 RepID=UPI0034E09F66